MSASDPLRSLRIYIGLLGLSLVAILAWALSDGLAIEHRTIPWIILTSLFFLSEYSDLYFHDERARLAVSPSEALLLPMLVVLSFDQVVIGVTVAIVAERVVRRIGVMKTVFNVGSFGCSAAITDAIWLVLRDGSRGLSIRDGLAATVAIMSFAALTHLFTAIAIALSEKRNVVELTRAIGPTTLVNLAGGVILGLFFAASYQASAWTIFLFPVALSALYLGNRAIAAQSGERQRVEHLHAATRALVAGPDLRQALVGFLDEVQHIASAAEARVVLRLEENEVWSGVRGERVIADSQPVEDGAMRTIATQVLSDASYLVVGGDEGGRSGELRTELGSSGFVAVPFRESEHGEGCLLVLDRIGAGDFDENDARLLEALANELVVSLGSFRLFSEVAEERERFGRIFAGSKEGICLLDTEGIVRAWNPALERITGHASSELMGKVWSDVVVIRDHSENRILADELVGAEPDEELELVTKTGPSRWVTALAGPVGEAEGAGWVVLVRDVSAEHEIEAAKSDFLSTISHELRTPLTTIKGSLQVLGRGQKNLPPELADQMIGVTTRGAERLERLVMNLLAVSQIESGTMPVFPDALALGEIVQERVAVMLQDHDHTVVSLPEKPLVVRADRERMSHTIEHLLENALKFGGSGGEIRIALERENGYARLSITDEGPGILTEDRERIFERFVRLGDVLTRETQGAGVGLFIASRSVQAMGGQIWVESTVGKGSTFYVTVPLAHPVAVEDTA